MFELLKQTNATLLGGGGGGCSLLAMLITAATCRCAYLNNKLDIFFGGSCISWCVSSELPIYGIIGCSFYATYLSTTWYFTYFCSLICIIEDADLIPSFNLKLWSKMFSLVVHTYAGSINAEKIDNPLTQVCIFPAWTIKILFQCLFKHLKST